MKKRLPQPPPGLWLFAHNDYLQTALEWGVVGFVAWALYFFGALARLVRGLRRGAWKHEDRTCGAGLLLALVGVAIMALGDFPLQIASLQLDVAVIAGLALVVCGVAANAIISPLKLSCVPHAFSYHDDSYGELIVGAR